MEYYLFIENGQINGGGQARCLDEGAINYPVSEEVFNSFIEDTDRYIWNGEEIIENPNYEEVKRQKEEELINNLTMTAQDLLEVIANSGATWAEIDSFLNSNPEFKLRLTTCQNVFCGVVKAFLPLKIGNITITAEMVETAFRIKNGEGVA
jgi:hypothetical protein